MPSLSREIASATKHLTQYFQSCNSVHLFWQQFSEIIKALNYSTYFFDFTSDEVLRFFQDLKISRGARVLLLRTLNFLERFRKISIFHFDLQFKKIRILQDEFYNRFDLGSTIYWTIRIFTWTICSTYIDYYLLRYWQYHFNWNPSNGEWIMEP